MVTNLGMEVQRRLHNTLAHFENRLREALG